MNRPISPGSTHVPHLASLGQRVRDAVRQINRPALRDRKSNPKDTK